MADSLTLSRSDRATELYRQHGQAIRAFIAARLRDRTVVEDLCQETFVVALRGEVPAMGGR